MEKRQISVRDGTFNVEYLLGGAGDPLLFLHGSGSLQSGRFLDMLAEKFTVYAPWHPGFGASEGIDHIDDVIDFALYYHDFMDAVGLDSPHVVGHSLGGMLAAELAALCSHRVRRLVLSNPVGLWRDDEPVLDFFVLPPQELAKYTIHDTQAPGIREAFPIPEGADAMMEALYQHIQSFTSAGKFLWPIPDRGLDRRIHRIQSPTLLLWGESDGLVPASYAEDFRTSIKDSRVVILQECAHMPMYEKPEEFVAVVSDFLLPQ
jgi:pimeloyl-ACP methyl ester carboxylesterase